MKTAPKYTTQHEATISAQPVLNAEVAAALATEFGFTARSVIAKIGRMPVEKARYANKAKQTKSGDPVEQKEAIVAQIETFTGLQLTGLEKAPKPVLQALRDALAV
jgi:hypothetical protein